MPAPSDLPSWATDTNYTNGPAGIPGTPTKETPSVGVAAEGHIPKNKAPAQFENWWKNLVYQWIAWFHSLKLDQGYRLKGIVVYTADATWTKPADVRAVRVTCVGGGGGGGAAQGNGAGEWNAGSGGGAGGTAIKLVTSPGATEAVTVGTGGNGGTSGGTAAQDGEDSSFGTHCVARRGAGGTNDNNDTATGTFHANSGGAGGQTGFTGDITINGGNGGPGIVPSFGGFAHVNKGGDSTHGNGGAAPTSLLTAGTNGGLYGGGGGGGHCTNNGSGVAGGNGANGIVIVEEFY